MLDQKGPQNAAMNQEDLRNMAIFIFAALFLYFTYDALILRPQEQAAKQARLAAQAEAQKAAALQATAPNAPALNQTRDRDDVLDETARIHFENKHIRGSIALTGGRLDDVAFTDFFETLEKQKEVVLLSPKNTAFPRYVEYGWVSNDQNIKLPGPQTRWKITSKNKKLKPGEPVTITWHNGQRLRFERSFAVDEDYLFTVTQRVVNKSGKSVTLHPYGLIAQRGLPPYIENMWIQHEGPIGWAGDELQEISYKSLRKDRAVSIESPEGWIGVTDKYWLTGLVPAQGENIKYRFAYSGTPKDRQNQGLYQTDFTGAAVTIAPGQTGQSESHVFTGAKKVLLLEKYEDQLNVPNFDLAVDFGMFWFMTKPFFYGLHFLGEFTGNLGWAIILLTILIRSSVFPLTNASYRSFAKMKKVAPQVGELREKYGEDKQKLQQALMEMYQREGVNPMAGCFPILLQIPIFFALYKILFITLEVRHAPFIGWIEDLSAPDPTTIFNLFGLIPWDPPSFLYIGVWPCAMLVAMIIQRKLNPPPQDPIQRDLALYFPFIITFVLANFAAGLVIYWACSAFIGVIQQMIIMHRMGVPIHLLGQSEEEEKLDKAVKDGPAVHPLAEMAEEDVEEALFGEDKPPKKISPPKPKKSKKKK